MVPRLFTFEAEVLPKMIDVLGHMNNTQYVQLFEEARWSMGEETGFGRKWVEKEKKGIVVVEFTVRFRKELHVGDRIRIETRPVSYRNRIGVLEQELFLEGSGALSASAKVRIVYFDVETRQIISAPLPWIQSLGLDT
jgi:acyl-CoA thioester hydrolase